MSDGMSDANAVGALAGKLRNAAYELRDAIKAARDGRRGLSVAVLAEVNEVLDGSGYHLAVTWEERPQ
jgi:hypothetical protein